jgi:hypothetical protein
MKYLILVLLILVGLGIGIFIGLGGFEGIGWVAFIIIFPIIYIFGTIIFGGNTDGEENNVKEEKKSKWDKYE